ncbi:MAG: pro-sigmaK processing inhibitor BofA family protein [Lachnospiraceae bacterium]|jgi:inhibitor of the pro-sigma K processing machinery|nr:pro-sigmaK processing inhibitor BofA family protein [Lachnospiraceae bacterium]
MKEIGIVAIIALCFILLLVGALKKRVEWLLNLIVRGVIGIIAIYFINVAFTRMGIALNIGLNPMTVLTAAILGFPGLAALYGLGFYLLL